MYVIKKMANFYEIPSNRVNVHGFDDFGEF